MIIFVIPAYNEAKNLPTLLLKTKEKMEENRLAFRILVINDGSTDGTLEVIESLKADMPVEVYSHYPNKGVGEVFRTGFRKALELAKDDDIIVTKEADNTSDLNILDELIAKIKEGNALALASCYAPKGQVKGTTPFKLFLSKAANFILKLFVPVRGIHTYSSFYRAYNAAALRKLAAFYGDKLIEENGFECMVELLIKFSRAQEIKIAEVPMVLDGSKRAGKSKMRILRTIRGFLRVIFREGIIYPVREFFRKRRR